MLPVRRHAMVCRQGKSRRQRLLRPSSGCVWLTWNCGFGMSGTVEITKRLDGFKESGLIADYEVVVVDDSVRVRIVAPADQDPAGVKDFVVEALAGRLSGSQVSVETAQE